MKMNIYKSAIIGILLLVVLIVIGNVMIIGDRIAHLHPVLAYLFYGLVIVLTVWLLVLPVVKVLLTPPLEGIKRGEIADCSPSELTQYQERLEKTLRLTAEEKLTLNVSVDRQASMQQLLDVRYEKMEARVREAAISTFVITAISQNGKFDFISTLVINFRLIKGLVHELGLRPTYKQLFKLYVSVVSASIVTVTVDDLISDFDFSSLLGLQDVALLNKGTSSLLSGVMNAFVTLRVGYATIDYLEIGSKQFSPDARRKLILKKARQHLWGVSKAGWGQLKDKIAQVVFPKD